VTWFIVLGFVVATLAVVGYALRRASRWAGERGWVFNKYNPRPRGSGPMGSFEQIFQPSIEHVIDEQSSERIRADQDESGDRPDTGLTSPDT